MMRFVFDISISLCPIPAPCLLADAKQKMRPVLIEMLRLVTKSRG
jgi:hypothetical protein